MSGVLDKVLRGRAQRPTTLGRGSHWNGNTRAAGFWATIDITQMKGRCYLDRLQRATDDLRGMLPQGLVNLRLGVRGAVKAWQLGSTTTWLQLPELAEYELQAGRHASSRAGFNFGLSGAFLKDAASPAVGETVVLCATDSSVVDVALHHGKRLAPAAVKRTSVTPIGMTSLDLAERLFWNTESPGTELNSKVALLVDGLTSGLESGFDATFSGQITIYWHGGCFIRQFQDFSLELVEESIAKFEKLHPKLKIGPRFFVGEAFSKLVERGFQRCKLTDLPLGLKEPHARHEGPLITAALLAMQGLKTSFGLDVADYSSETPHQVELAQDRVWVAGVVATPEALHAVWMRAT